MEAIVSVRAFTGTTTSRTLTKVFTHVRAVIGSARVETMAMLENVPTGQVYEFTITDHRITGIPDGAELTVTNPQTSGFEVGDIFIVVGKTQRQRMMGRFYIVGVCYKKP